MGTSVAGLEIHTSGKPITLLAFNNHDRKTLIII